MLAEHFQRWWFNLHCPKGWTEGVREISQFVIILSPAEVEHVGQTLLDSIKDLGYYFGAFVLLKAPNKFTYHMYSSLALTY